MGSDLRAWINMIEDAGQLSRIEGAHWDLEIGCISGLSWEKGLQGPAILFDRIADYPAGYRVVTNTISNPDRIALTLGFPKGLSLREYVEIFRKKLPEWRTMTENFPPQTVRDGPVLENVDSGKDVDLFKFPAPRYNPLDGGRYIGTGNAIITRDPDTGKVNIGTYRNMIHDSKTAGFFIAPGKHGRLDYEKYHARNEACPVLISLGHHPLFLMAGGVELPTGSEYSFIGAITGEPLKIIREEITGLPMPADSEIVLAGWSRPGKVRHDEGPFGEWTGYYASREQATPVVEIERVYHRNDPIILGAPPSRPPGANTFFRTFIRSALLHNQLEECGLREVKGVWQSELGGSRLLLIISINQKYAGHARQTALFASQSPLAAFMGRYVIVVDEDIDPTNIYDVLWAVLTRSDPEKDIDVVRRAWSSSLDPVIPKTATAHFSSRAIIDACKPYEWRQEFADAITFDPELVVKMKKIWGKQLGL
ncbi:MAG: UbiD family decarboxylase [Desulfobacterales bacterium]|nr:UbiD family decarboxylase [Desulfobacterales bacterium]